MWFQLPDGTDQVSVELQTFKSEVKDKEGRQYFRAPDHFAPLILDLPGFRQAKTPPDGAPPDLPKSDPLRDGAIGQLGSEVSALKTENEALKKVFAASKVEFEETLQKAKALNDDLKLKLHEAEADLANVKTDLEELQAKNNKK